MNRLRGAGPCPIPSQRAGHGGSAMPNIDLSFFGPLLLAGITKVATGLALSIRSIAFDDSGRRSSSLEDVGVTASISGASWQLISAAGVAAGYLTGGPQASWRSKPTMSG